MDWSSLFSPIRSGDEEGKLVNPDRLRTSFIRDYDRIIFSSAFRRLQNKTQIFPLPGPVFVHNRLTHSLEVASVGRSLGREAGARIVERANDPASKGFEEFYKHELGNVIAAACLAHDIGNPPFGHSGEDAIRAYFRELAGDTANLIEGGLSTNQLMDFHKFEGNSNALRVLSHAFNEPLPGGYNLTLTTLASIVKYPSTSLEGFDKKAGLISCKKSGYFDSEIDIFKRIAGHLGLLPIEGKKDVFVRHPFVYLTEAADDICYRVVDLEDAHRLGIAGLETFIDLFLPFFKEEAGFHSYSKVASQLDKIVDPKQKIQYLRAVWIGLMVSKLSDLFIENEELLLSGGLQHSLMDLLPEPYKALLERVNDFSHKKVYNYRPVIEIEMAGYHIIGGLLDEFVTAVLHPERTKSDKLLRLISPQFPIRAGEGHLYGNLQSIVDFVSGMTDVYAIDLYRKITGIHITELR